MTSRIPRLQYSYFGTKLEARHGLSKVSHSRLQAPLCGASVTQYNYPVPGSNVGDAFPRFQGPASSRRFSSPSSSPETDSPKPLDGIIVIALEQVISAPYCTRHLADNGARVIKIERPGSGDFARLYDTRANGLCSHFAWVNRSKESLALDIKKPEDLEILKALISKADVFVQNLKPGAAEGMGLGYEELRKGNEGLIVCGVSGYGSSGGYKDKKAYDLLIQAEAGVLSITGTKETPSKVGMSIADIAAGMYAYSNVMAALMLREKTGKGCRIDVSMLECMVEWMGFPLYFAYEGQQQPGRKGADHASIYPYGIFKTGEGDVMLGLQNEREWKAFCDNVLGWPELVTDERFSSTGKRSDSRQALKEIIEDIFRDMTAKEVVAKLDKAGIGNSKVNNLRDVWEHPQLEVRNAWRDIETEHGSLKALVPPGTPNTFQPTMGPIPKVGEHNVKILQELKDGKFGK